ncbi:hypothetical protein D6D01_09524 [Aureobasidium pullulans]|uniref:WSC domain-containing protein n=1 Tax=Aureobasidium pullulans TaxID=5580 RepID=A0A4S9K1Q4_AURPU|nr:hypothetical protein D6D01_09524 [Aureobasidium pullulans]
MKLSLFLLTIAVSGVMMSPTINRRQNDVQKCVKGQGDMKGKAYDECFLNEGPDQPNAGLLCKGYCRVVGHPAPISECRGEYSVPSREPLHCVGCGADNNQDHGLPGRNKHGFFLLPERAMRYESDL